MKNLLKKNQLLQLIILFSLYILNNKSNVDEKSNIIYKTDKSYILLKKIVEYTYITNDYINLIKKNIQIPSDKNHILLENNEYFYLFYNKYNTYVYFFKENNNNVHNIYFNGINNKKDIKILIDTIVRVISNKFDFEHVENIIEKDGYFFDFTINDVKKINFTKNNKINNTLMNAFDYIYKNKYINNDTDNNTKFDEKINLNINGYSLGGIFSQVFVYLLVEKYGNIYKNKFNIDFYNIESWFGGNEEKFNNFIEKINMKNIYNKKSIFSYHNIFFQPHITNTYYIESDIDSDIEYKNDFFDNNVLLSPLGIINYITKNHFLSHIFK